MTREDYKDLMMGYLDGELSDEQKAEFEQLMKEEPAIAREFDDFRKLKQITDDVSLLAPEDRVWQQYWSGVYNRIERGLGWILFSVAAIVLLVYGGFKLVEELIHDPTIGWIVKIAVLVLIVGIAILLVSITREKLYLRSKERYKDIRR